MTLYCDEGHKCRDCFFREYVEVSTKVAKDGFVYCCDHEDYPLGELAQCPQKGRLSDCPLPVVPNNHDKEAESGGMNKCGQDEEVEILLLRIKKLERERKVIVSRGERYRADCYRSEQDLAIALREMREKGKEIIGLRSVIKELEKEVDTWKETEEATARIAEEQCECLQQEVERLKKSNKILLHGNPRHHMRIDWLEEKNAALEEEAVNLRTEIQGQRDAIAELRKENSEATSEIANLRKENEELVLLKTKFSEEVELHD